MRQSAQQRLARWRHPVEKKLVPRPLTVTLLQLSLREPGLQSGYAVFVFRGQEKQQVTFRLETIRSLTCHCPDQEFRQLFYFDHAIGPLLQAALNPHGAVIPPVRPGDDEGVARRICHRDKGREHLPGRRIGECGLLPGVQVFDEVAPMTFTERASQQDQD